MRKKRVLLDYSPLGDDELNTLAGKVLDCLEGHAVLVEPPVELEDLQAQADDFRNKWQTASNGGSVLEFALKNDARELLLGSLKDIAFYVNKVGLGSRSLLLSSGLHLEADPKPSEVPDQVIGVGLADGKQKNQMIILFLPQKGALLYEYQITDVLDEDNQPVWNETYQTSNSRSNVYAPTVTDHTYYLRVRARNKKGIGDWSEITSLRAR